jgi:hypothetical protein
LAVAPWNCQHLHTAEAQRHSLDAAACAQLHVHCERVAAAQSWHAHSMLLYRFQVSQVSHSLLWSDRRSHLAASSQHSLRASRTGLLLPPSSLLTPAAVDGRRPADRVRTDQGAVRTNEDCMKGEVSWCVQLLAHTHLLRGGFAELSSSSSLHPGNAHAVCIKGTHAHS